MYAKNFTTINDAVRTLAYDIIGTGKEVKVYRDFATDNDTIELHPCLFSITNPRRRVLLLNGRANNPFAQLYELMWVMSGSRDLSYLKFFLPRCEDWADTAGQWRAGYGPRLRRYIGLTDDQYNRFYNAMTKENRAAETYSVDGLRSVDQIKYVVKTLQDDSTSRRAVMTIWDPAKECTIGTSKDFPCTGYIQFLIRDGRLDCSVTMRSNDLYWGASGINIYEFTYIQEMIANKLNIEVGTYYHYTQSLHIYRKFKDKVSTWYTGDPMEFLQYDSMPVLDLLDMNKAREYMGRFNHMMIRPDILTAYISATKDADTDTTEIVKNQHLIYLVLYVLFNSNSECFGKAMNQLFKDNYARLMSKLPNTDMKVAAHWYFRRESGLSKDVRDASFDIHYGKYSLNE